MTTLAVLADMTARPNRSPWISSPPIVRLTAGLSESESPPEPQHKSEHSVLGVSGTVNIGRDVRGPQDYPLLSIHLIEVSSVRPEFRDRQVRLTADQYR